MAYLNCPFCPAQGFPLVLEGDLVVYNIIGYGPVVKYRCISNHEFYVNTEDVDGSKLLAEPGEVTGHCF